MPKGIKYAQESTAISKFDSKKCHNDILYMTFTPGNGLTIT